MNAEKVSVIIPVYNEGKSIGDLVSQINSYYLAHFLLSSLKINIPGTLKCLKILLFSNGD